MKLYIFVYKYYCYHDVYNSLYIDDNILNCIKNALLILIILILIFL